MIHTRGLNRTLLSDGFIEASVGLWGQTVWLLLLVVFWPWAKWELKQHRYSHPEDESNTYHVLKERNSIQPLKGLKPSYELSCGWINKLPAKWQVADTEGHRISFNGLSKRSKFSETECGCGNLGRGGHQTWAEHFFYGWEAYSIIEWCQWLPHPSYVKIHWLLYLKLRVNFVVGQS